MDFITLNNKEKIAYVDIAKNINFNNTKVIVLLHGNMSSSSHFDNFINNLTNDFIDNSEETNYRIIAPDLRGFGLSSYNTNFDTFDDLSNDIIELLDNLNIKNFVLIGHYIGTAVAMEICAKLKNQVEKLILVSPVSTMGMPLKKINSKGEYIDNEFLINRNEIENDVLRVKPIAKIFNNKDKVTIENILDSIYNNPNLSEQLLMSLTNSAINQRCIIDIYVALSNFNISDKHNGITQGNNKLSLITAETLVVQSGIDNLVPIDNAYLIKYFLKSKSKIITGNFGHSPFLWDNDIQNQIINFIKLPN